MLVDLAFDSDSADHASTPVRGTVITIVTCGHISGESGGIALTRSKGKLRVRNFVCQTLVAGRHLASIKDDVVGGHFVINPGNGIARLNR